MNNRVFVPLRNNDYGNNNGRLLTKWVGIAKSLHIKLILYKPTLVVPSLSKHINNNKRTKKFCLNSRHNFSLRNYQTLLTYFYNNWKTIKFYYLYFFNWLHTHRRGNETHVVNKMFLLSNYCKKLFHLTE